MTVSSSSSSSLDIKQELSPFTFDTGAVIVQPTEPGHRRFKMNNKNIQNTERKFVALDSQVFVPSGEYVMCSFVSSKSSTTTGDRFHSKPVEVRDKNTMAQRTFVTVNFGQSYKNLTGVVVGNMVVRTTFGAPDGFKPRYSSPPRRPADNTSYEKAYVVSFSDSGRVYPTAVCVCWLVDAWFVSL